MFDLSQLLAYKTGDYSPEVKMNKIESNIKVFFRYLMPHQFGENDVFFHEFSILLLMTYDTERCINVALDLAAGRKFSASCLTLGLGNMRIVVPRFHIVILNEPFGNESTTCYGIQCAFAFFVHFSTLRFNSYRVVTKSGKPGNSGRIKEFYFQSGKIRGRRKILCKIKENQGSYEVTVASF